MKKLLLIVLIIFTVFNCSQKENQIQMAKEYIEKIGKNPTAKDISDMFYTAKIYYGNNPEVAIIYFEKVVNYKPESLKYLTDYYLKKKDYRNFEKWAKIAAEKGINDVTYNLAYYYETNGKIQEAIEYYMIAAKNGDKSSENNVVNLYVKRGNDEETKKILREFRKIKSLKYYKAQVLREEKKYDEAIKIFRQMIEEGDYDGYVGWGSLLEDLGKKEESMEVYKKGSEKGNYNSIFILGTKYGQEKKYDEAKKYFLMAVKLAPNNEEKADSLELLGLVYERQENFKEAREYYKKAINLGNEPAKELLKNLENDKQF